MNPQPRRLSHGSDKGAGAAFAVGTGNVNDGRQAPLGMIQAFKQCAKAIEAEVDHPGVKPREAGGNLFDNLVHAAAC
jgi:hypothetical protein